MRLLYFKSESEIKDNEENTMKAVSSYVASSRVFYNF